MKSSFSSIVAGTAFLCACGPPAVQLQEAYGQAIKSGGSVDHGIFDTLLKSHVDARGLVDYKALQEDHKDLDAYIAMLGEIRFDALGRDEKLAVLINGYNAFTLSLIVEHFPLQSIMDIAAGKRWKDVRWQLGELVVSLDEIENQYLRPKFKEPRIHFAINCASISCPPLRREAYRAATIDEQLEAQMLYVHSQPQWFVLDTKAGIARLTKLYDWYSGDFVQVGGSVLDYAARYDKQLAALIEAGKKPAIAWLDYNWNLNRAN